MPTRPPFAGDPCSLICPFCGMPVTVGLAKTDESGKAIHEDCYVLKTILTRSKSKGVA